MFFFLNENLLENVVELIEIFDPSVFSRRGSLLPSTYADARSALLMTSSHSEGTRGCLATLRTPVTGAGGSCQKRSEALLKV